MSADASGRLPPFQAFAALSAASTNVDASKVEVFGQLGEVVSARSLEVHKAGDVTKGLASFRARQGAWLVRREAFEGLWEHGLDFIYAALNAGGLGTRGRYGSFCLVMRDPEDGARPVAVFPGDSAQRYTTQDGAIDEGRVRREATQWADRDALTVIERHEAVLNVDEPDWPNLICRPEAYMEVVIATSIPVSQLAEVRLPQSYLERLEQLESLALAGEDLTPSEGAEVQAFEVCIVGVLPPRRA